MMRHLSSTNKSRNHLRGPYAGIPPIDMLMAPRRHQIDLLDAITHTSEPNIAEFVESFSIQQANHDCDRT